MPITEEQARQYMEQAGIPAVEPRNERAWSWEKLLNELSRHDFGSPGGSMHRAAMTAVLDLLRATDKPAMVSDLIAGFDGERAAAERDILAYRVARCDFPLAEAYRRAGQLPGYDFVEFSELIEHHRRAEITTH